MEICTPDELARIARTLEDCHIPADPKTFEDPSRSVDVLSQFVRQTMEELAQHREAGRDEDAEQVRQLLVEGQLYGARILQIGDPRLARLRGWYEENNLPAFSANFQYFMDQEMDLGAVNEYTMAEAMLGETHGFRRLEAPTVPDIIDALQDGAGGRSSSQLVMNAGGTKAELMRVTASGQGVRVHEMSKVQIPKIIQCVDWDTFWALHFTPEILAQLQGCDPQQTTVVASLAFPIESFESCETGRTDGKVIHFADKYMGLIGPKNQAEAARGAGNGRGRQSLATSLRLFLCKVTGKNFSRITIVPNDTVAGRVAFALEPDLKGMRVDFVVNGTGNNETSTDRDGSIYNTEAGHHTMFRASLIDRIAAAQAGREGVDAECAVSGGLLAHEMVNTVRLFGGEGLVAKLPAGHGERTQLMFDLTFGHPVHCGFTPREEALLRICSSKIVKRAARGLATSVAALHVLGTERVMGEGGMLDRDFMGMVNGILEEAVPGVPKGFFSTPKPPATFDRPEDAKQFGDRLPASAVGSSLLGLGDDLLTKA